MSEQTHHEPAYLLETEALINRPAFEEPHLESTLRYQGVESLPDIVTEPREVLYVSALRVLATARRDERPGQLKPETRATWNEDWSHALTRKKAREIAEQSPASVYSIHDALASLQKSEHLEQNHRAIYDGLRAHQQPYMQGIADFMKEPPIIHDITNSKGETHTYIMRGATVEAPTGAGKTALIGRTAVAAGIGETFIDEQQQERARRMLVVVPSRALVRQFTGKAGDDTFRRFAPGLSVGGYYSSEKTTDTDVVVMTVEKFVDEVRNNQLDGQTFDLLAIDEAHHLLAPQFLDTVLEQWTKPIIGFTATPERSELRDIRDILPTTIKHADTLSYILEGVLNGAQLFLMRVDPNYDSNKLSNLDLVADKEQIKGIKQETINKAVVDFVRPLLEQGRRGIIFCNPGDTSKHARDMALALNELMLDNGKQVNAACLMAQHTLAGERPAHHVIGDYDNGKIDILTTVDMAKEGLNAEIDFVVIAQTIRSKLILQQCIGRGTRLSERFPYTIYAQFVVPSLEANLPVMPLHEIFGLDLVQQGERIGPELASKRKSRIQEDDANAATVESFLPSTQDLLQHVEGQVASEVHLSYKLDEFIPPDYVSVREIYKSLDNRGLKLTDVQRRLDRAGYSWKASVERVDGKLFLHRHYEPNAATFFSDSNLPPLAEANCLTANMLTKHFGLGPSTIDRLLAELHEKTDIHPLPRLNNRGRIWQYYGPEAIEWLEQRIEEMPVIEEGDVSMAYIAAEIDENIQTARARVSTLGFSPTFKRPANPGGIFMWAYSKEDYEAIMTQLEIVPRANSHDVSIPEIARATGVTQSKAHKLITEEERATGYVRRAETKSGLKPVLHLSRAIAEQVIARGLEQAKPLSPDYILLAGLQTILDVNDKKIPYAFRDELVKIKLANTRNLSYVNWGIARQMVERYGYRPGTSLRIDFDRLPTSPDDNDPGRIAYARAIQLHFMTARQLGNPDGIIDL